MGKRSRYKDKAREALNYAVRKGKVSKPDHCQNCGTPCSGRKLHGHHWKGYEPENWHNVIWLCWPCHVSEDLPQLSKRSRLTKSQVVEIRRLAHEGVTMAEIAVRFGYGKNGVQGIINNKRHCDSSYTPPDLSYIQQQRLQQRRAAKTHCPHGHALTPDNIVTSRAKGRGEWQSCKKCVRAAQRKANARWRASHVRVYEPLGEGRYRTTSHLKGGAA